MSAWLERLERCCEEQFRYPPIAVIRRIAKEKVEVGGFIWRQAVIGKQESRIRKSKTFGVDPGSRQCTRVTIYKNEIDFNALRT